MSKLSVPEMRGRFEHYCYYVDSYGGTRHLDDAYKKPSEKKQAIWQELWDKAIDMGGGFISITSSNCYTFTVAWLYVKGNKPYFHVELPSATGDYLISSNDMLDQHAGFVREFFRTRLK